MARIRRLTGARAWAARLSGLLVLAAIVALVMAVLPAFGINVAKAPVDLGGQPDDCSALAVGYPTLEDFRIENPQDGTFTDPETGAQFTLDVKPGDKSFDLLGTVGADVSAIVVKGGAKSVLYDFARLGGGPITSHTGLEAPDKDRGKGLFNISHVSFCYVVVTATISGTVWHDNDQNGDQGDGDPTTEPMESGLNNWTVNLYKNNVLIDSFTPTPGTGAYSFAPQLATGTFTVCEVAPSGQWAQSVIAGTTWTIGACGNGSEEPDGHVVTSAGLTTADFGNFMTVTAGCGSPPLVLGGNTITFPGVGPLCDKDTEEYVFEAYLRANGEQVVDFHPIDGSTGGKKAHITEVLVWTLPNQNQNSTTLNYNDGDPNNIADDRVAEYCNHDPRPLTAASVVNLLPGPAGFHTTCIIESTEGPNAAGGGVRTDVLYSLIDGRRWM